MKWFWLCWLPASVTLVCIFLGGVFYVLAVFAVLDLRSRIREMRRISHREFNTKIAWLFRQSRCQRNMYVALHGDRARAYFRGLDYRWWHFIPDTLVNDPIRFFTPRYLRQAYFV